MGTPGREKHEAFADALEALFEAHPVDGNMHRDEILSARKNALNRSTRGILYDVGILPAGVAVPIKEMRAIHVLIYG
jgi:hypothetical protein